MYRSCAAFFLPFNPFGRILGTCEFDPEPAAYSKCRLDPTASAHALGSFLDDSQTNPGARVGFFTVKPLEHVEDTGLVFGRDADAVVLNPQPHAVAFAAGANANLPMFLGFPELCGIADQIGKDLA